jgi:hypothetical protein
VTERGSTPEDDLVARAIRELTHAVPGDVEELTEPAESPTSQPWAETASPSTKNKRPLEALLAEYTARVAQSPDARASLPPDAHPSTTFFERFDRGSEKGGEGQRRRKRRRFGGRRGRGGTARGRTG